MRRTKWAKTRKAALERLSGTLIKTNIRTDGEEITEGFGLIDSWRVIRNTKSGRILEIKVSLSDWIFNAAIGREVLTLHRDYFRLRKPLEGRIYELAREHCGHQDQWGISLATLKKKCGSASTDKEFRRLVANISKEDAIHHHIPDYAVSLAGDKVLFQDHSAMNASIFISVALRRQRTLLCRDGFSG